MMGQMTVGAIPMNTTESHTRSSCANSHPPRSIQQDGNGFHSLQEIRKWVDVRMIDFARSTHHRMTTNQSSYLGPDEGYIHGLATLIGAFESILTSLVLSFLYGIIIDVLFSELFASIKKYFLLFYILLSHLTNL